MKSLLLVTVLFGLYLPALEARVAPHIIGGRSAKVGEFPYQGSLQRKVGFGADREPYLNHICGCVLLSKEWVVTAAHCIGGSANGLSVMMGVHERGEVAIGAPRDYYIDEVTVHPGWDRSTLKNDIALIKLFFEVDFNEFVKPIPMFEEGDNLDGLNCVISGWGVTTTGGGSISKILRAADVSTLTVNGCQGFWGATGPTQICAWEPSKKGACNGDSGGPLACNGKLAGISSFGKRGCFTNLPSVFTRIPAFRPWIKKISGL